MTKAIQDYLVPLGVTLPQSDRDIVGGYFMWFRLPSPLQADAVARLVLEQENLIIGHGLQFRVYDDAGEEDLQRAVRLCFAWEEEENLTTGVERLGKVVGQMLEGIKK